LILKQGVVAQDENPQRIIPNNAHDLHRRIAGLPAVRT
jgi:hypothetical protein